MTRYDDFEMSIDYTYNTTCLNEVEDKYGNVSCTKACSTISVHHGFVYMAFGCAAVEPKSL